MGSQKTPRYQGTITSWKDEQGFGFIAPNGGGANVFVHIKSLTGQKMRPADGLVVTYELTVNAQGKPRAENVAFVLARTPGSRTRTPALPVQDNAASTSGVALVFRGLIGFRGIMHKLPLCAGALYLGMSEFLYSLRRYGLSRNLLDFQLGKLLCWNERPG